MYLPEMLGSDGHCLRPDGAGGGYHDQEEAAHPQHLEGRVEGGPGPEPAQSLHPLHDDWQGEHARGRHGDPGHHHLGDPVLGTGLGEAGHLALLVSEGHPLHQLLLPH